MTDQTSVPKNRRGRILVVEDNEASARGLTRLLQAEGFEVSAVLNGASALQALSSGPPPDFLLTDMQLPDMDGREVARHAMSLVPPPRIILVTGWDLEIRPGDSAMLGIDQVIYKPVNLASLVSALGTVGRRAAETPE